ncbi:hypothetical protein H0X10_03220 [Candidatus Saccharibacteria bacterium]|nr:hypothetical protein [Candidatus Saccharibacteria bacterium]
MTGEFEPVEPEFLHDVAHVLRDKIDENQAAVLILRYTGGMNDRKISSYTGFTEAEVEKFAKTGRQALFGQFSTFPDIAK